MCIRDSVDSERGNNNMANVVSIEVMGCGIPDANGTYVRFGVTCGVPYFYKEVKVNGKRDFFRLYRRVPAGSTRSETRLMGGYWCIRGWNDGDYGELFKCEIQDCNDLNPINKKWVLWIKGSHRLPCWQLKMVVNGP